MNLKSHSGFWPVRDGKIKNYPSLKRDLDCEVAVIGGGISGAMIAYYFSQAGIKTVLLEKGEIGLGSTSASTALLLYELDTHLSDLSKKIGPKRARRCYQLCYRALKKLEKIIVTVGVRKEYRRKKSLYLASREADVINLKKEWQARRRLGFKVDFLDRAALKKKI